MKLFLLIAIVLCVVVPATAQLSCLDEAGNPVDWWYVIKAPKYSDADSPILQNGHAYQYFDNNTVSKGFMVSTNDISTTGSAVGATLNPLFLGNDNIGWVMWNDEKPSGSDKSSCGHSKGTMGITASGGFYLVHSVPKFPEDPSSSSTYSYPTSGEDYGQSMLCMTLSLQSLNTFAGNLQLYNPQIYTSSIPDAAAAALPQLTALIGGTVKKDAATGNVNFTTIGGEFFSAWGKNTAWNNGLYSNLVGPAYNTALEVETWMRPYTASQYPPDVPFPTLNAMGMQLAQNDVYGAFNWTETKDHSKIAISIAASHDMAPEDVPAVLCVGDINHQKSQYKRGGGTVCSTNPQVYSAFQAVFGAVNPN